MKRSLRSWLWRVPLDQEFDEEIALHIEMRTRELMGGGMGPASSRAIAVQKMGDVATVKATFEKNYLQSKRAVVLDEWLQDRRRAAGLQMPTPPPAQT